MLSSCRGYQTCRHVADISRISDMQMQTCRGYQTCRCRHVADIRHADADISRISDMQMQTCRGYQNRMNGSDVYPFYINV